MPLVQLLHVGDEVELRSGGQDVRVFGEEVVGDDSPPVVLCLEVRVGEANENLR